MGEREGNLRIPRPPDVVTIVFERNPFTGVLEIVGATVIGSARPCQRLLDEGDSVKRAANCLLKNGFELEFKSRDILLFRRDR
ncbi:hypothetical protein EJF36_06915 [Bacillus sp. HMF5848]|uniref:hypothetical protein n=1 Tax=Bacillus sp. HMF5848 TaxID=2495421 RepID=UPI000F774B75|nr:hypothetical protein [Bacillus sp. HMF5848]RSK26609.1 hypothetical protein EJF36_06915 [Bacillus sp. HMF5848]